MAIGNIDTKLTKESDAKTRTDFKSHKHGFWSQATLGQAETQVVQFMEQYKAESATFIGNPMFQFFYEWLKTSCDYYKDVLSVNTNNNQDAKLRGIIAGQREILIMMDFMKKPRKQEAK